MGHLGVGPVFVLEWRRVSRQWWFYAMRSALVGALLAGLVADEFGILAAIWVVAALTAASGLVVAVRMYETRPARPANATKA